MIIPFKKKSFFSMMMWMMISEMIIIVYLFFVVPSSADVNLHAYLLLSQPFPDDIYYLLPILVLLGTVIIVFGNFKIYIWAIGIIILYIGIGVFIDHGFRTDAFGFWLDLFGGVGIITIPFWCIFFFLWELLFCMIAKLWRIKRRRDQQGFEC